MMRGFTTSLALLIPAVVDALLVAPSSPQCADLCGNELSSTSGQEITCEDAAYASSTYGATFQACLACELSSTYVDAATNQSDLQWGLYNLRFALAWCLFGFDNNTAITETPCITRYGVLSTADQGDVSKPGVTDFLADHSRRPLNSTRSRPMPPTTLSVRLSWGKRTSSPPATTVSLKQGMVIIYRTVRGPLPVCQLEVALLSSIIQPNYPL